MHLKRTLDLKKILIIGAGRSSNGLISYLKNKHISNNWHITLADYNLSAAESKIAGLSHFSAKQLDVRKEEQLQKHINEADIIISLVPAHLHYLIALQCVNFSKTLVTASYVNPEIQALHEAAKQKGVLLLMEMGLDPGIDHLSAKEQIDKIQNKGGEIKSFKSFTGGLIAPESDDNPWHYKFTWNPRNVVLAGQGAVKFLRNGALNYIPYHNLFKNIEKIEIAGYGNFEAYANRDSLKYQELYGLTNIETLLRGTLRKEGFCEAWDAFVQLGFTDDTYEIEGVKGVSYCDFLDAYLPANETTSTRERLAEFLKTDSDSELMKKLLWIGICSDDKINIESGSPAAILQSLLEKKWTLKPEDKDMIIMNHSIDYELDSKMYQVNSTLVIKGDDAEHTSMSKTVGIPIGIAIQQILSNKWQHLTGVHIPTHSDIYNPVLKELEKENIIFSHQQIEL